MSLNQDNVQDWPLESRQDLLNVALAVYGTVEYSDVCVVGGRMMGWAKPDSDIDVIIYIDDYVRPKGSKVGLFGFCDDMKVSVVRKDSQTKLDNHQGFTLPLYSLITNTLMNVDAAQINAWLDYRIAQAPLAKIPYDFMEGRTLDNLIVERT